MREVYVGGMAQGKLDYVRRIKSRENIPIKVVDCDAWRSHEPDRQKTPSQELFSGENGGVVVFYHFHRWVRNLIADGADAEREFGFFLERYPDWIIVSDEVGNGIVPMEKEEREYRECLGRILIEAAERADRVERIICGLGQRIK